MSIVVIDYFNGPASQPLSSHFADAPSEPWLVVANTYSDPLLLTGDGELSGVVTGGSVNGVMACPGTPTTADYTARAVIKRKTGSLTGLALGVGCRINTGASSIEGYFGRYNADGGFFEVYCFRHGETPVAIGSPYVAALTIDQEYEMELTVTGTSIELFVDGVPRVSGTNSFITTAGRAGLYWITSSGTAFRFTEFTLDAAGLEPPPDSAWSTLISDTFTGSAVAIEGHGADTPSGRVWRTFTGLVAGLTLSGEGTLAGGVTTPSQTGAYLPDQPTSADYEATIDFTLGTGSKTGLAAGVIIRANTGAATLTGYNGRYNADSGAFELYSFVAGAPTLLGSWANTPATGISLTLTVRAVGSVISLRVNGVERISAISTAHTAVGRAGIVWFSTSGTSLAINAYQLRGDALETYIPGPLTALGLRQTDSDGQTITLGFDGGNEGTPPYTYALHRAATSGATPTVGNRLSANATFPYVDTAPTQAKAFYRVVVTDAAAGSAQSKQAVGEIYSSPINVLYIGDSVTNRGGAVTESNNTLRRIFRNRKVNHVKHGVNGSISSQWISGSSNLETAIAAAQAQSWTGQVMVSLNIGINDCHQQSLVSAATYRANVASTVERITGLGWIIILQMPHCPDPGVYYSPTLYTEESIGRLLSYQDELEGLIRGGLVRRGDRQAFGYFARNPAELEDGLHQNATGDISLGRFWAHSISAVVSPPPSITGGGIVSL